MFNSKALNYLKFKNGKSKTTYFSILTSIFLAIIIYLLGVYFSLLLINSSKYVLMAVMPFTICLVITIASLVSRLDIKEGFKLNRFSWNIFWKLLMVYVSTYILGNFIVEIIAKIFPDLAQNYDIVADYLSLDNLPLSVLIVAILPAVFEELLFRGVLFNSFNKKWGPVVGAILSALLFGIFHMNWLQGIYAFIFGIVLAYSYYKSNSLYVPITFHFVNNFIATLMSFYEDLNFEISTSLGIFLVISALILIIVSIYIIECTREKLMNKVD